MKLYEGIHDKYLFKAVFLVGGPGSGKSFFRKKILHSFKSIDPDDIRKIMFKKHSIPLDTSKQTKEQLEKRYNSIDPTAYEKSAKRENIVISGRLPVVFDRTGRDYEKTAAVKRKMEALGYETKMIYVNTHIDEALKRNASRQRKLEPELVASLHSAASKNIDKYKSLFGKNFYMVNNTKPMEENQEEYNSIWKKIAAWIEKPVKNSVANDWIKQKQKERNIIIGKNILGVKDEIKGTFRGKKRIQKTTR